MKCCFGYALLSALLLIGCGKKDANTSSSSTSNENYGGGNPVTAPVGYLGAMNQAKKGSEKTINLVQVKQAVQLFHAGEGRFPGDLNELVAQKYLPKVPEAPNGMRLSYDPNTGNVEMVRTQ